MTLKNNDTKWVLFLSSSEVVEHRHMLDLAFGLQCLESAGIHSDDIFIYVDGHGGSAISNFVPGDIGKYLIRETKDFFVDQMKNTYKNMMMFITGHGSIDGIDANPPITPFALLSAIKVMPSLKTAVVYLGQCYAGIFNYVAASKGVVAEPEVVFIGATNLHQSLSLPTKEDIGGQDMPWSANVFLLYIFKWLSSPVDVDGDGKYTIIDSYKYGGVMSNELNKYIKANSFSRSIDLHHMLNLAKEKNALIPSLKNKFHLEAVQRQYDNELGIRYIHQECWILNSTPAQAIEL